MEVVDVPLRPKSRRNTNASLDSPTHSPFATLRLRSKSVVTNTRPRRSKSEPSDLKGNWENSFNMSELFPNFYNLKTFQAKLKKLEKEEKNSNDEMSSPNQTITIPNFISQGNFSSQKTNTSSSFEEEVCYDSNQSSSIKYASTKFLIDSIIYVPPTEFQQSKEYINCIILVHPLFVESITFFNSLISPFKDALISTGSRYDEGNCSNVVQALDTWIKFREIIPGSELHDAIKKFATRLVASSEETLKEWGKMLLGSLLTSTTESLTAEKIDNRQIKTVKKRGSLPKLTSSPQSKDVFVPLQFLDIPPKELAIHITAGDWKYFKRIKITELIHKSWTKEDVSLAPNILALINRFNRISRWIASEILLAPNLKQRVTIIEKFIELAEHFKELNNFHSLQIVNATLNNASISRLKGEWKEISRKHTNIKKSIETLMSADKNYKTYREYLKHISPPFIPFEGVLLQECIIIDENPDYVNKLVNFLKVKLLGEVVLPIKKNQELSYENLKENSSLTNFLENAIYLDEKKMFEISQQITFDFKKSRRRSNSNSNT